MSRETVLLPVMQAPSDLDFGEFFHAEYPRLLSAAYLLVGDFNDAEDLAQEAMVRAYERWEAVQQMDSPAGYVYRTALNLHRKALRRLASRAKRIISGAPSVTDPAALAELRDELGRALDSLSSTQRQALVLVEWVGLDTREAARILGIQPESVRVRLHRARAAVQKNLEVGE
jgi:RNA polymerase sigma factor (sigma-70 family)